MDRCTDAGLATMAQNDILVVSLDGYMDRCTGFHDTGLTSIVQHSIILPFLAGQMGW